MVKRSETTAMMLHGPLKPQPSERWVMYRILCPIIDASCIDSGFEPFFEYSLPSQPNSTLKVDIALLSGEKPVWYIEAKKFTRSLSPKMVEQYLHGDVMGAVTNGNYWIFLVQGRMAVIGPVLDSNAFPVEEEVKRIEAMFTCTSPAEALATGLFTDTRLNLLLNPAASMVRRPKADRGTRQIPLHTVYADMPSALDQALGKSPPGSITFHFLEMLREKNPEVPCGQIEVNDNRIVWTRGRFDRLCRIKLKSWQLNMVVAKEIIEWIGEVNISARLKTHDQNINMIEVFAGNTVSAETLLPVFAYPGKRS